jgi:Ca2+-binding EF-hand superfamily protein
VFEFFDRDQNYLISVDEFVHFAEGSNVGDAVDKLREQLKHKMGKIRRMSRTKNPSAEGNENDEEQDDFRVLFGKYDKDGSGSLDREEFMRFAVKCDIMLTNGEMDNLMKQFDENTDGKFTRRGQSSTRGTYATHPA